MTCVRTLVGMLGVVLLGGSAMADDERLLALEKRVDELSSTANPGMESISISGYGELHYSAVENGDNELDQHRMVVGVEADFSEWVTFDMEVDFEHAAQDMELESAEVSFLASDELSLVAGVMLLPIGDLNDTHEPVNYYSVERAYLQTLVIPTSWSGAGAGLFGQVAGLSYSLDLVGGLDAHGFTGAKGIRDGRMAIDESTANDLAIVGRVSGNPVKGLTMGVSGYQGDSGQDTHDFDASVGVTILEADASARLGMFELKGAVAQVHIDDTEALNSHFAMEAEIDGGVAEVVGKEIAGWNVEADLHLYSGAPKRFLNDMVVFARYEMINTQDSMAEGYAGDPANNRDVLTGGIAYFPVTQVAIKLDVENWSNHADDDWTVVNAGLAFIY